MEAYAAYRVLMVEDDRGIAQAVQTQGELWNLQVRQVRDLRHVMEEFAEFDPHLVLLDIGLPCFDGYHWCTEIRRVSRVPVIFISSAADNMNIIMAMNLGADDFITKPFDQSVLMAKIQALLRRTYNFGASAPVLEHRGALLNTGDNTLTYQGQRVSLTKNEYRILLCLMQSKGRTRSPRPCPRQTPWSGRTTGSLWPCWRKAAGRYSPRPSAGTATWWTTILCGPTRSKRPLRPCG